MDIHKIKIKPIEIILREYPHIPERVQALNCELNSMIQNKQETYNTLQAAPLSDTPRGSETSNLVLKAVEEIVDKFGYRIIEITEEINKWLDMQQDITKIMYSTDNIVLTLEERRIIELRYFNQYHCQRVANIVKYSKMQVYRISDKAIDKIQCEYDKVKLNKSA